MKDILSCALNNIKKNGQIWILAILAFSFLMTIGVSLSYLIGMLDVLLIAFVVCPFIFAFINICSKSMNDTYLEPKDIYYGYKGLGRYLAVFTRTLIRPALLFLLIYFGLYMVVAVFDLFFFKLLYD